MSDFFQFIPKDSFRNLLKQYKEKANEIESHLNKHSSEWGKYQNEFNHCVNDIFRNIMIFEIENLQNNREDKVYKLKRLFINKMRHLFVRGQYIPWSLNKPFGYAGDFKIIDDIYQNIPSSTGFNRLFDNYFQMSSISIAVRNRKNDFKHFIIDFVQGRNDKKLSIMDLASGPCRDICEVLSDLGKSNDTLHVDCYEQDINAIEYAQNLLNFDSRVTFIQENAIRLALKQDINSYLGRKYDLIFSTGLFDYFNDQISIRLIKNLKKLLLKDGVIYIANVRDKYSNPSVHFMEWVGDWNLVYRNDDEFRNIFINAGFENKNIQTFYEQQGIIQYIKAT